MTSATSSSEQMAACFSSGCSEVCGSQPRCCRRNATIFVVVEYGADELVVYGFVVELVCGMDVVELNIIVVVIMLVVVEA